MAGSNIGLNIKLLREKAGMTQDDLAKILKVSRPAVTSIEQGRRRVTAEELGRLARALRVSTDQILGLVSPPSVSFGKKQPDVVREPKATMRISVPQKNVEKFKEVLLYVLARVGAKPNMGETVLYKLLYFIDFDYYEKYEEQLIGATYQRNHFGPTPMEFGALVDAMSESRELVRVVQPYFDFEQKRYLPLRNPDLSKLSGRELDLINDVLHRLSDMSARQISEYSHKDIPWLTTEEGDVIAYESVFYRTPEYSVRAGEDDGDEVS
jgi:transcriptional regulator with XRE-family HTH domain